MALGASAAALWTLAVLAAAAGGGVDAARVLGFFPFNGRSHFVMFAPLLEELAARGHHVTVVGHHPLRAPRPNYTDIDIRETMPAVVNGFSVDGVLTTFSFWNLLRWLAEDTRLYCEAALAHPQVQRLARPAAHGDDLHFDLLITEQFGSDCGYGFAHRFQVPVVTMTSSESYPWSVARVGTPDNPSYIPLHYLALSDHMSFSERILNTAMSLVFKGVFYWLGQRPTDELLRRTFGEDTPPLSALLPNTSLMLVNSFPGLHPVRPTVPAFVEVGGLHIRPPAALPKDLQSFLDGATEGAVFFSLGSLVRTETMEASKLRAFVDVFRELPQRVLWKCDAKALPFDLPPNVRAQPWMPQNEILNHPNVRLFITHGGLMGTQEAVWVGVPTLAVPLFADQLTNGRIMERKGAGRVLRYQDIAAEPLRLAVRDLLTDPRYLERARALSRVFRDRPQSALATAVWWTEYVVRHRGAPHLRSAAVDLPAHSYLLLDVAAALAALAALLAAALWLAARALCRACGLARAPADPAVKPKHKAH